MSYDLFIGDKAFSSWSLRGWLLFEKFGIPYREHMVGLYSGTMSSDMAALAPARYVPAVRSPEGHIIGETSALVEILAERHPEAGLWPDDQAARIRARWLVAEMHAGFMALRNACPMQLFHQFQGFVASGAVQSDLNRLDDILGRTLDTFAGEGSWLFGRYSAADAFYAPVAARIAGYDLPVSTRLRRYVEAHLTDPAFCAWRKEGIAKLYEPMPYVLDLPTREWP